MDEKLKTHVLNYLKEDIRFDSRKSDEFRPIRIEYDIAKTAEGSVKVSVGETEVLVGVKFEVGLPYPDKQEEGTIMVNAELLPMSSPDFEAGPPDMQSIELARVVDRGIRESNTIDMKKLCIKKGELVWTVVIDVCSLNDAGNLIDASSIGAVAALKSAYFPKLNENNKIDYKSKTDKKIDMNVLPVAVTVHKIGQHYVVDPTTEEETVSEARLTITTLDDGTLCALQKGGDLPLSLEDIEKMMDLATRKGQEIRKIIKGGTR